MKTSLWSHHSDPGADERKTARGRWFHASRPSQTPQPQSRAQRAAKACLAGRLARHAFADASTQANVVKPSVGPRKHGIYEGPVVRVSHTALDPAVARNYGVGRFALGTFSSASFGSAYDFFSRNEGFV